MWQTDSGLVVETHEKVVNLHDMRMLFLRDEACQHFLARAKTRTARGLHASSTHLAVRQQTSAGHAPAGQAAVAAQFDTPIWTCVTESPGMVISEKVRWPTVQQCRQPDASETTCPVRPRASGRPGS
jgi:hypothetical protein